ncbi:MAG TPA: polysaccharide pyruvyl transferase family protein [Streptosporangiaceae bacterium]
MGLFGLLGSGNIGNDASMESVLRYLRADHPDAVIDAMAMGPEGVTASFGISAVPLLWSRKYEQRVSGVASAAIKAFGKGADAVRTAAWVRRHDVVIVPGMGVLETSLPLRPWGVPYSMFLLSTAGRLFGTKVALVSVGATVINQRATRWLFNSAARLAFYRSYRDTASSDAMRQRGVDTSRDHVFPDLVFGIPAPPYPPGDPKTVGVGVMAYSGTNDHRAEADAIYASYLDNIKRFIRWLIDDGRNVRLLVGDTYDDDVVQAILADLRESRPGLDPSRVAAEPVSSFAELMRAMAPAGIVVATRYHNVMCALKLTKPAISLGYSSKNTALMADMGMSEFSQFAHELDVDKLIEQFTELERRSDELRPQIAERHAAMARQLAEQFTLLNTLLFGRSAPAPAVAGPSHEVPVKG